MRFLYLFVATTATINLLIVLLSVLTDCNLYKMYGKQMLKVFCQFLLILLAFIIALAISGLST